LLLFVLALSFKWRGRCTAAVLALLLIAPIHQTYSGLALLSFAAISALSRPELFSSRGVRLLLVGIGLIYVVRERFFEHFSVSAQLAVGAGLVVAALLFFRVMSSAAFAAFRQRYLGRWLDQEVFLDAWALVALVILLLLVSVIGDRITNDPITRRYVWSNIPTRTLSFVRFPVFIAFCLLIARRLHWHEGSKSRFWCTTACALSCLLLSFVSLSQIDRGAWHRLGHEMRKHLGAPRRLEALRPKDEEERIYAHLVMVAAGDMEASAAEASILRERPIECPRPKKKKRKRKS
ncbi:MAG TPA: hypothetical protein VJU61_15440, partial [Polyangiaceae bacterium]|nr:hypothetical protein [Polyangiaceae bacterium]